MDEWGRRRIDGLLDDGIRILIAAAAPIIKTWTAPLNTSHVFSRPSRLFKLTQSLNTTHTFLRHRLIMLSQALQTLAAWTVIYPGLILKQWFASLNLTHTFKRSFRTMKLTQTIQPAHVFRCPTRIIRLPAIIQPTHLLKTPNRLMKLIVKLTLGHVYFVAVPGKKTKMFFVIGNMVIDLATGEMGLAF